MLGQTTYRPSVWCSKYYFFFIISCKILCKNRFNLFFYNFTKMKVKSFECPKSIRNYEKKNAWNIRRLVNESFVPASQRIILKNVGFQYCIPLFKTQQPILPYCPTVKLFWLISMLCMYLQCNTYTLHLEETMFSK